jgi:hypothetical protein
MKQQPFALKQFRSTDSLLLPEGWSSGPYTEGRFSQSQEFFLREDERAAMIVACRGHELQPDVAQKFQTVLSADAHELHELERQRISQVLDNQSMRAHFAVTSARTEDWQGLRVLVVEGTYLASGDQAFTLFVDCQGNGSWVEEFQYSAPVEVFGRHFNDAMATFKSIKWTRQP